MSFAFDFLIGRFYFFWSVILYAEILQQYCGAVDFHFFLNYNGFYIFDILNSIFNNF